VSVQSELAYAAPVLAVCGFSGSGKTTLLEAVIPALALRGLAVAVLKHDAHGIELDKPGKDSDRLFRAGASVVLCGPQEQFEHRVAQEPFEAVLARLARDHDLVLVEGYKHTPLPKFWLHGPQECSIPDGVTDVVGALDRVCDRPAELQRFLDGWLARTWNARPLYGGLLVGGESSRMGTPKQLLRVGGQAGGWAIAEISAAAFAGALGMGRLHVLGSGELPESVAALPRLLDAPGFNGPGAGLLAAHRWSPDVAWIVSACDHPALVAEHVTWLLKQRRPGCWAVIPRQSDGHPCPTLALYEPQALEALERLARTAHGRDARPSLLIELPHAITPEVPGEYAAGWRNVNSREELRAEERRMRAEGIVRASQAER
jgi:molybdopterin-guanine dinucleotide biosynthesis protein MobB